MENMEIIHLVETIHYVGVASRRKQELPVILVSRMAKEYLSFSRTLSQMKMGLENLKQTAGFSSVHCQLLTFQACQSLIS